ncbi:hypothetical protein AB0F17_24640 [Nonomuraea sp. NPDC026600]|uniref:hypothetical protein n=1 Tax=Nonomuraea sp. NPDC026600 TaxID=3155363 RepID=UPI0033E271A9
MTVVRSLSDALELPPPRSAIRILGSGRRCMHYNRLAAVVLAVNTGFLVHAITADWWADPSTLSLLVVANVTLAVLIRQQYVINLLFRVATDAPVRWPLAIRRILGKVYHFGGLHVGGTVAATLWFAFLAGVMTVRPAGVSAGLLTLTYAILALLVAMVVFALPSLRARLHNMFEVVHRFGGWTVLALFWAHALLTTAHQATFWALTAITLSVALPWLRLRRVPVRISRPSSHVALLGFDYGVTPFAGSSTTVSRNPLLEWHSFANVPTPGRNGFRLTVSRAGDWTGSLIDDGPSHLWVKGIPTAGVGNIDKLFARVVWVATGSGIGPCLPHLLSRDTPSRLVWSTRRPRTTYGDELVEEILAVQPDAVVWDTDAKGKPDLLALAYRVYVEFDAEAIICISNKKTTWHLVEQLEMRGVPAYGAIWDS